VLDCSNNELDELDISNNTLLTGLQCQQNELLNCIQVWDVDYAESNSDFYKDEGAVWSLDCDNNTSSVNEQNDSKILLKKVDILGRVTAGEGLQLEVYDDGAVIKKYLAQ